VCALPTFEAALCGQCLKKLPHFAHTEAAFSYQFPLDKLIQDFKYRHNFALANAFAERLARRVTARPDCLVAMPLHPARLRERGFNQSHELAKCLANQLNIPLLGDACQRVRNTAPQASLKWKERRKNIRHAFTCNEEVRGKHVAVVDDVMTSGASLNELAQALKQAGASEVSNWVVARTVRRG
jgi:ComF family protein